MSSAAEVLWSRVRRHRSTGWTFRYSLVRYPSGRVAFRTEHPDPSPDVELDASPTAGVDASR